MEPVARVTAGAVDPATAGSGQHGSGGSGHRGGGGSGQREAVGISRPASGSRVYRPPFLSTMTGIVFAMIRRSSVADRRPMYSRSSSTFFRTSSMLVS